MKRPILIVIALVCIITGCKLDEAGFKQSSTLPNTALVGMWFVKYVDSHDPRTGTYRDTVNTDKDYFMFSSDHSVQISTSYTDTISTGKYAYYPANKKLVITNAADPSEIDTWAVKKLTADSLVMSIKAYITLGSGNNTGVDSSNVITYRFTH